MDELQILSRTKVKPKDLYKVAFKYPLKRSNYNYKNAVSNID